LTLSGHPGPPVARWFDTMRGASEYRPRELALLVAAGIVVAVGVVVAADVVLVDQSRPEHPVGSPSLVSPSPVSASPTPKTPPCPSARLGDAHRLGQVAWIQDGSLKVIDLGSCRQRTLVATGARPPVRFSADG